ncbi:MAG: ABC transporter ATP-binding protein, partial [Phycisphaerales bacterium]|nr:ABC transporter ATP-binding protein [Phycisphaerales bacterium]
RIKAGERVALLGPNGAGKTTLIRAIAGRCRLDRGEVTLFDEPANARGRSRIGLVPQELAVHGLLTAEENLRFFGRLYGVRGRELSDRVAHALDWTGLESRRRDLVKTFSGGMKRRLNIACGVLHQPELVLLDEPTVGVDPQSRERIHEMLLDLHDRGAALLLTTHMMEEAQRGTDRIVIQDHGRTVANGTAEELVDQCFGARRTLQVTFASQPEASLPEPWQSDGLRADRELDNVGDVAEILRDLSAQGIEFDGLQVESPSLQEVFLHLTGKELRE